MAKAGEQRGQKGEEGAGGAGRSPGPVEGSRTEKEKLELLFSLLPVGVSVLDAEGSIVKHNRSLERILGLSEAEFEAGKSYEASYIDQGGRVLLKADFPSSRVRAGIEDEVDGFELRMLRSWGEPIDLSVKAAALPFADWKTLVITSDISEQKRAEAELRKSEAKYRLLFENAGVGIAHYALDGTVLTFNKRTAARLGGQPEDFEGRNLSSIFPPAALALYRERFALALAAETPLEFEDLFALPGGAERRYLSIFAVLRDLSGRAEGIQVVAIDVSEKHEAERRLKAQREQLIQAEKLASLGTLVAGVAHEINNPNHVIMLEVDLISRVWSSLLPLLERNFAAEDDVLIGGVEYAELRTLMPAAIRGLREAAANIDGIVRGLKDFASPVDCLIVESVDLNLVVRGALALVSSLVRKSTEHFELVLAEGLPLVRGNFQRLEQVVVNLVQNACQALSHVDQGLRVLTRAEPGRALIEIIDEGRGMGAEELAQIKDPFYTTRREEGGTGLGVSISNAIIEEHGGTLAFSSSQGRGTRSIISLPAAGEKTGEENP
jgi:PAS domain S-box-containing protein